ncbi:MAG: GNAT family N-acetyltransferase [Candidatus Diapherotrites archaeon]
MKEKVWLRQAQKSDIAFCAELIRKEFGKKPYNEKWSKGKAWNAVKKAMQREPRLCFIAMKGEKRTGMVFGWESHFEPEGKGYFIEEFIIAEEFQGQGIGKKTLQLIEKKLAKKGFKVISLLSHKKAFAFVFYQKNNFKEYGLTYLKKIL